MVLTNVQIFYDLLLQCYFLFKSVRINLCSLQLRTLIHKIGNYIGLQKQPPRILPKLTLNVCIHVSKNLTMLYLYELFLHRYTKFLEPVFFIKENLVSIYRCSLSSPQVFFLEFNFCCCCY
jgi:hypothetical protein